MDVCWSQGRNPCRHSFRIWALRANPRVHKKILSRARRRRPLPRTARKTLPRAAKSLPPPPWLAFISLRRCLMLQIQLGNSATNRKMITSSI